MAEDRNEEPSGRVIGTVQERVSERSWRSGMRVGVEDVEEARRLYEEDKFEPTDEWKTKMGIGIAGTDKSDEETRAKLAEKAEESDESGEVGEEEKQLRREELEALPWAPSGESVKGIRQIAHEVAEKTGEDIPEGASKKSDYVDYLVPRYEAYLVITGADAGSQAD